MTLVKVLSNDFPSWCRSDRGVTAGHEGPECNLGDRERAELLGGDERRRSAERKFGQLPAHRALIARKTRPATMGIRMTHRDDASSRSTCPGRCECELLSVAGLYEFWPNPELPEEHPDKWLVTATAISTSATDALGHIHERSPLIILKVLQADWLDPATTVKNQVRELVSSVPEPHLVPRVIGNEVGSVGTMAHSSSN